MRNILLKIAYDGTEFHGWQRQANALTVQGHLEQIMSKLFNRDVQLSGTSRTDAGVHALAQHATFQTDINIPIERLPLVVNNALCAAEGRRTGRGGFAKAPVRILEAVERTEGFHARFDCKGKKYIYRVHCGEKAADNMSLIFDRNYVYPVGEVLDVGAMNEAAKFLEGTHDFKSFEASGGNPRETTVRTIYEAKVMESMAGEIQIHVKGDGFLYNMVRIITGTLVEVGQGKRVPNEMKAIIEAAHRPAAGHTAPPNGLYLAEVYYEEIKK